MKCLLITNNLLGSFRKIKFGMTSLRFIGLDSACCIADTAPAVELCFPFENLPRTLVVFWARSLLRGINCYRIGIGEAAL